MSGYVDTIAKKIIQFRFPILFIVMVMTIFFGYNLKNVKIRQSLSDILPAKHPYVKTDNFFYETFGGTNLVVIGLVRKDRDIFNLETLNKIYRITLGLEGIEGVVPYRIVSIASRKLRNIYVGVDPNFPEFPTIFNIGLITMVKRIISDKDIDYLNEYKQAILRDPSIYGSLVSADMKGTVILADFHTEENFIDVFNDISAIINRERDENHEFFLNGRPILLAYIAKYMGAINFLFLLAIASILFLLFINFHDIRGMFLPLMAGLLSVVLGLGIFGFFGLELDMLSVIVRFFIFSIEISHAVQILNRYYEEYYICKDNKTACVNTIKGLFKPGMAAIVTDSLGFFLLFVFPFKVIRSTAIVASTGVFFIFITTIITLPCILSILKPPKSNPPKAAKLKGRSILNRSLIWVGKISLSPKNRIVIIFSALIILIISYLGMKKVIIGEAQPGSPFFWKDSLYNQDKKFLDKHFSGTNPFYIVIKTKGRNGLFDPKLAKDIDRVQNLLKKREDIGYVLSYVDVLKQLNLVWHDMDKDWFKVPEDRALIAEYLYSFVGTLEPDVTKPYFDGEFQYANIQVFFRDHQAKTIFSIIKELNAFLKNNKESDAQILPGAGLMGNYAAIIDEIRNHQTDNLICVSLSIFIFVSLSFRSLLAGLIILIPLGLGTITTFGVMGYGNIGLFLYTLPVASMGMGLGVDYGIYLMTRLKDELKNTQDPKEALSITMCTSGKAVLFTAMSVILGTIVLTASPLRFQAIMGGMLSIIIFCNMVGSLLLLPTILLLVRPKCLFVGKT